jgi:hypothetical protein
MGQWSSVGFTAPAVEHDDEQAIDRIKGATRAARPAIRHPARAG